jgi:hypothetical protein
VANVASGVSLTPPQEKTTLFLSLIKHNVMKMYRMGRNSSTILNLSTSWT